jgi:hypothetical protein
MTISVEDTKDTALGDGTTTSYDFTFKVDAASELLVFTVADDGTETPLVITDDYTVTLNQNQNSNPGGTIVFVIAPGAGVPICMMRNLDFVRSEAFTTNVPPNVIESELDRLTMYAQQLREKLERSLHVSAATQAVANLNYGNSASRAAKLAGFDTLGNASLFTFAGGSIIGPAGPMKASRVEYDAPAIFRKASNSVWSHNTVTVTFTWAVDGTTVNTEEVIVTIDEDNDVFDDPGLTEPTDPVTSTLVGTQLLNLTSEYDGIREYAQLAMVDLPADDYPTDTFTPAWGSGEFTIDPVGDVSWTLRGTVVTLFLTAALSAESATSAMTWDAATIPVALRPDDDRSVDCIVQYNDSTEVKGQMVIGADGSAAFYVHVVASTLVTTSGVFQTGEDKGLPAEWSVTYTL